MEHNIRSDSSFETVSSDHLLHENNLLRKIIREKEDEIAYLKSMLSNVDKPYPYFNKQNRFCPPYGS